MASTSSLSSRRQQSQALKARNALVLEHLSLADSIATKVAWRFFPIVDREDLIQVAREALIRSAPSCRAGEPAAPYLRRCISGALRLTILEGLSLREAGQKLSISAMSVQRAQKKALEFLRLQLAGAG